MSADAVKCLACGGRSKSVGRAGERSVLRCPVCLSMQVAPWPDEASLQQLYTESYYDLEYFSVVDERNTAFYDQCLDLLRASAKGSRLLDVGCGAGQFLKAAGMFGYDAVGVEPGDKALEVAERSGLDVMKGSAESLDQFGEGSFDVVTMLDVLEHTRSPHQCIASAARVLKPGGVLLMTYPNPSSLVVRVGELLAPLGSHVVLGKAFPREHLFYPSVTGLGQMLKKHGVSLVQAGSYTPSLKRLRVGHLIRIALFGVESVAKLFDAQINCIVLAEKK